MRTNREALKGLPLLEVWKGGIITCKMKMHHRLQYILGMCPSGMLMLIARV